MRREMSIAAVVALVAVLIVSLLGQLAVLPAAAARAVEAFPEVEPFAGSGVAWGVLALACLQVIALCSIPLVLATNNRAARGHQTLWRGGAQGATLLLLALIIAAIIALNTLAFATPGVMLALIVSGIAAFVGFGLFTISRSAGRAGQLRPRN